MPPLSDLPPLPPLEAIGEEWSIGPARAQAPSNSFSSEVRVSAADAGLFEDLGGDGGADRSWGRGYDDDGGDLE